MNVLDMANPFEKYICDKADANQIPIGATFELLPVCNMDCSMCYVRMSKAELEHTGKKLLSREEWLNLADEGQKEGLLFLLLTGGEPFLYPDFPDLYEALKMKGLVISINTNGTLIDEKTADRLAESPPRRINISLYGGSNDTYRKLCNNPEGFDQVLKGAGLLKERGIALKFNYSVTPFNIQDKELVYNIGKEMDIPVETVYYMFPPARKQNSSVDPEKRLTPQQSAAIRLESELRNCPQEYLIERYRTVQGLLSGEFTYEKRQMKSAFSCRSGSSTCWINWKGEMVPCGMMDQIKCDVMKMGFHNSWKYIKNEVTGTACSPVCKDCVKEIYCGKCAACATSETGRFDGVPEYVCEAADWYVKYLEEAVNRMEMVENENK